MADPVERDREAGLARPAWVAVVVLLLVTVAALGGGVAMGRSSATSSDLHLDLGLPLLTWPGHSFVDTLVVHRDQRDLDT